MSEKIAEDSKSQMDDLDENVKVKQIHDMGGLAIATAAVPPKPFSRNMLILYFLCIAPYMCGTMNGYDGSVMGSFLVEDSFKRTFNTQTNGFMAGMITAMYQIGSVCALPFIGFVMDTFGRRACIFFGCLCSVVGAIVQATSANSANIHQFLGGRFLLGFGATLAQSGAVTYCVEIAHPVYRGAFAGGESSMLNLGGLIAAAVTLGTVDLPGNANWLVPTWTQIACPGLACVMIFFQPESPRWQYTHGKVDKAVAFIVRYHGMGDSENPYVKLQLAEFEEQLEMNGADKKWWDYRILFSSRSQWARLGNSLMIGIWGALSSGGISYFIGAFFESAGITNTRRVLTLNVWQNFMSTVASFIGSRICDWDSVGRRGMLLPTLLGMCLSWAAIAVSTRYAEMNPSNVAAAKSGIAFYFVFSFIYCIGITPLQGVYAVEVFSYEQRAKGVGFQSLVVAAVSLINQFATPVALERIGYATYIVFCGWNFIEFCISYVFSVETKGYTLEELDVIFESPNPVKASLARRRANASNDMELQEE